MNRHKWLAEIVLELLEEAESYDETLMRLAEQAAFLKFGVVDEDGRFHRVEDEG